MGKAGSDRHADRRRLILYVKNVGHDPRNLPTDHPDRWQWEYVGNSEDKERLQDLVVSSDAPTQDSLF